MSVNHHLALGIIITAATICTVVFRCTPPALPYLFPPVQAQLPMRSVSLPGYLNNDMSQMIYSEERDALYAVNVGPYVLQFLGISSVPLLPADGAPWSMSVLAGGGTIVPVTETSPLDAAFITALGAFGWPLWALSMTASSELGRSPTVRIRPLSAADKLLAGLFVSDNGDCTIRYIDFQRQNNVHIVAGLSNTFPLIYQDGVGSGARLMSPSYGTLFTVHGAFPTSVLWWTDQTCIRQGTPVNVTTGGVIQTQNMKLQVKTVIGVCETTGSNVGLAYVRAVTNYAAGAAVVAPFLSNTTMTIAFLPDYNNHRILLCSPMFPDESRAVAIVYLLGETPLGVTPVWTYLSASTTAMSLFIGNGGMKVYNLTFTVTNQGTAAVIPSASVSNTVLLTPATISGTRLVQFVARYGGGGTMVILTGARSLTGNNMEFYCCLAASPDATTSHLIMPPPLLSPVNVPNFPFTGAGLEASLYDRSSDTWYVANSKGATILSIVGMSSVPISPVPAAWQYTLLAGSGTPGAASAVEVSSSAARFNTPTGIEVLPSYAVDGTTTAAPITTYTTVGLWVCDRWNHAIRFINFLRSNGVTLVAGSSAGASGATDGMGSNGVRLNQPDKITSARFLTSNILGTRPSNRWSTLVLFSDRGNGCIRQGIPTDTTTMKAMTSTAKLQAMVLDTSMFIGTCGSPGRSVGIAFNQSVLSSPAGLVLVNPFASPLIQQGNTTARYRSTIVLFVTEYGNNRVSVVSPLFPPTARYLASICSFSDGSAASLSVVRVNLIGSSTATGIWVAAVELFVGMSTPYFMNVTSMLTYNGHDGSISLLPPALNSSSIILTTTQLSVSAHATLVPLQAAQGTLVVFSGTQQALGATSAPEYFCCLGLEYYSATNTPGYNGVPSDVVTGKTVTFSLFTRPRGLGPMKIKHPTKSVSASASTVSCTADASESSTLTTTRSRAVATVRHVPSETQTLPSWWLPPPERGTSLSVFLPATLGASCADTEVVNATGLGYHCSRSLSSCVANFSAGLCPIPPNGTNASAWALNCSAAYMDCMVAAAFSVSDVEASHRRCPFASMLQHEVNDAYSETVDFQHSNLYVSCVVVVRNISIDIALQATAQCQPASGVAVNATLGTVANATLVPDRYLVNLQNSLCSRMSKATQDAYRQRMNASTAAIAFGSSSLSQFPALRLQSSPVTAQCDLCESATLSALFSPDDKLGGMIVLESEAIKPNAATAVKAAAAGGCGTQCSTGQPYRSTIGGLASPSAMGAPAYDVCRHGAFNLTLCSATPSVGMFAEQRPSARRVAGRTCQPHPATGLCACPPPTQAFTFPSGRWVAAAGGGAELITANVTLCLLGAEAFLFAIPGGRGERSALFGAVASGVNVSGPFTLVRPPATAACIASFNRTTECRCQYDPPGSIPTLTAVPFVYRDVSASAWSLEAALLVVCWSGASSASPSAGHDTESLDSLNLASLVLSIIGTIVGGPAAAALLASDLMGARGCDVFHRDTRAARLYAAVPVRIGMSPLNGIAFLACIVIPIAILHAATAAVVTVVHLQSSDKVGTTRVLLTHSVRVACAALRFPSFTLRIWLWCVPGVLFESVRVLAAVNAPKQPTPITDGEMFAVILTLIWVAGIVVSIIASGRYVARRHRLISDGVQILESKFIKEVTQMDLSTAAHAPGPAPGPMVPSFDFEAAMQRLTPPAEDDEDFGMGAFGAATAAAPRTKDDARSSHVASDGPEGPEGREKYVPVRSLSPAEDDGPATQRPPAEEKTPTHHAGQAEPRGGDTNGEDAPPAICEYDVRRMMKEGTATSDVLWDLQRQRAMVEVHRLLSPFVAFSPTIVSGWPPRLRALVASGQWPTATCLFNAICSTCYDAWRPRAAGFGAGLLHVQPGALIAAFVASPTDQSQCTMLLIIMSVLFFVVAITMMLLRPYRWPMDNGAFFLLYFFIALQGFGVALPTGPMAYAMNVIVLILAAVSILLSLVHLGVERCVLLPKQNSFNNAAAASLASTEINDLPSIHATMNCPRVRSSEEQAVEATAASNQIAM